MEAAAAWKLISSEIEQLSGEVMNGGIIFTLHKPLSYHHPDTDISNTKHTTGYIMEYFYRFYINISQNLNMENWE